MSLSPLSSSSSMAAYWSSSPPSRVSSVSSVSSRLSSPMSTAPTASSLLRAGSKSANSSASSRCEKATGGWQAGERASRASAGPELAAHAQGGMSSSAPPAAQEAHLLPGLILEGEHVGLQPPPVPLNPVLDLLRQLVLQEGAGARGARGHTHCKGVSGARQEGPARGLPPVSSPPRGRFRGGGASLASKAKRRRSNAAPLRRSPPWRSGSGRREGRPQSG